MSSIEMLEKVLKKFIKWVLDTYSSDLHDWLQNELDNVRLSVTDVWSIEDVHNELDLRELPPVTDKEAKEILKLMEDQLDANDGFNFETLDRAIDTFFTNLKD